MRLGNRKARLTALPADSGAARPAAGEPAEVSVTGGFAQSVCARPVRRGQLGAAS